MSILTGPITEIYAATIIPSTSAVAMTAFEAKGNSVSLHIVTVIGGCGSLTFTAEEKHPDGSYHAVTDRDSVWSFIHTPCNTAGSYAFDLEGLDCKPRYSYRLSYQAATAAGSLQVTAINWENPKGGGISVSVPDVVVDVGNIDVNIEGVEQAHGDAVGAMGFMNVGEAKAIDGSAVPNLVSEGQAGRPAQTLAGGRIVTVTDKDALYAQPTGDATARPIFTKITDATTDSDVLPLSAAVKPTGALGVAGEIVDFDSSAGEDFTAAIGVLGKSATGSAAIPAGDAVANSIFVAIGNNVNTAVIDAANTARTTGTVVIATQPIDASGNVLGRTAANTARTTATLVDPVQLVDAAGNVVNVTAANTARTTGTLTLPTQPIDEAGNVLGRTAANTARTTGTLVAPCQPVDAAGLVLGRDAANTARTTGTLVNPVQVVDGAGNVLAITAANTARTTATTVLPTQTIDEAGNVLGRTAADTARTTGTLVAPCQPVDAAGLVLGRDAANTARTTGTLVNPVQIVDAAGNVINVSAANTARTTATIVLPVQVVGSDGIVLAANKPAPVQDTGSGAMSKSIAITAPSKLLSVECKFSAAPTTGAQPLTVTKDNVTSAAYDVVWYSQDIVALASTSFSVRFNPPIDFYTGDACVIAFANTDGVTYGMTATVQVV